MAKSKAKSKSKGGIGKIVAVVLAVLFIAGIVCAAGFGSKGDGNEWFKNGDITTWFNSWGKGSKVSNEPQKNVLAIGSEGEKLTDGSTYAMGRGLTYFTARDYSNNQEYAPDGEITLTATLSNEYIKNGVFDWSVKFANGSSEWASGKVANYFVSVTPVEGNSSQAKLKYLAPFAEQIEVTATLRGTSSSDTCTVDCIKSVTLGEWTVGGSDFDDDLTYEAKVISFGTGTVTGEFTFDFGRIILDEGFVNAFKSYLTFDVNVLQYTSKNACTANLYDNTYVVADGERLKYSMFIDGFDNYDQAHKEAIYYAWSYAFDRGNYLNGSKTQTLCDISFTYSYNGTFVDLFKDSDIPYALIITGGYYGSDVSPSVTLNKNVAFGGK